MTYSMKSCWSNNGPKYIVVVVWLTLNTIIMYYTYHEYKQAPEFNYLHQMLGAGLCWSRGTAAVINLNLGILLLPMCRSLLAVIRGAAGKLSVKTVRTLVDHCKGFHVMCSYIVIGASLVHFFGHCFNAANYSDHYNDVIPRINAARWHKENPVVIVMRSVPGVTGVLLLVILSMIVSSAVYAVRSACYDVFWYIHRLFFIFYLLVIIHGMRGILKQQTNVNAHTPGCVYLNLTSGQHIPRQPQNTQNTSTPDQGSSRLQNQPQPQAEYAIPKDQWTAPYPEPEHELARNQWICDQPPAFDTIGCSTWKWTIIPLTIYLADMLYRLVTRHRYTADVTRVTMVAGDVAEIELEREGFTCRPGQYVLLQCPSVSMFEWHPYTVTQVPDRKNPDNFTVHVKTVGDWAVKVADYLLCEDNDDLPTNKDALLDRTIPKRILVDGPFGSAMEDVLRYRVCLCVAGGIGITPFIALLNHLRCNEHKYLQRLYLVWICKDIRSYPSFAKLICDIHSQFWERNRPDVFNIQLYVTNQVSYEETSALDDYPILRKRLSYGRPNWSATLSKISTSFPGGTVGVFCCGPKSLTSDLEGYSIKHTHKGTSVHFYHESF